MRRILIISNTYYQLIMAIHLKNTLFIQDEVVLLLSDHSKNTESISSELNKTGVFESVKYIKTLCVLKERKIYDKIRDYFQISFLKKNRYKYYLSDIDNKKFDEIIFYNYGIDIYGLYSFLSLYNNSLKASLYEESILSYNFSIEEMNKKMRIIGWIRKVLRKPDIMEGLSKFYCFYKHLYRGKLDATEVPNISEKSKTADILREIFKLEDIDTLYKEKYIFFTSVYDFEGGKPIGEFELARQIADMVGKENLLIKIHPRDRRSIYEDNGFKVDKNSAIPWEAIQLAGDFSDKIFLTATSSSVLAGSLMSEKPTKTFYMYKCCNVNENTSATKTAKDIEALIATQQMRSVLENVTIAKEINDIV